MITAPRLASLALLVLAGCGTYRVNRSALAPHPSPIMHSGHPLDGMVEIGGGVSSAGHLRKPAVGNPDSGVEVPGTQIRADGRLRLADFLAIGFLFENGLDSTSAQPREELAPVNEGNVIGYGMSAEASVRTRDPRFRVGLVLEAMIWHVPWVEWRTCVEDCFGERFTYETSGVDAVTGVGLGVVPSWRSGRVTWFGGLNLRTHPDIEQKGIEGAEIYEEGDVRSGPLNLTASVGAELDLGPVKGSLIAYQTLTQDPVQYGPSVAAMLTIPLGREMAAAQDRRNAPAEPPPPPPPPGPYAPPAPGPYGPPPYGPPPGPAAAH